MIAKYIYNSNDVNKQKLKKNRIRKSQCSHSRGRLEKALSALSSSSEIQGLWVDSKSGWKSPDLKSTHSTWVSEDALS